MEIFFTMIKNNPNINALEILGFKYLLTSYADDTTFFVKDTDSIKQIFETFETFSDFSGLNANLSKCEISGIGVKNGVQVALLGMKCINLKKESIKILGVHFSYNNDVLWKKITANQCKKLKKF